MVKRKRYTFFILSWLTNLHNFFVPLTMLWAYPVLNEVAPIQISIFQKSAKTEVSKILANQDMEQHNFWSGYVYKLQKKL